MSDFLKGLEGLGVTVKTYDLSQGQSVNISVGGGKSISLNQYSLMDAPQPNRPMPSSWKGTPPATDFPASVTSVLQRLNGKTATGDWAVSDAAVVAAKRNLASYWGFSKQLAADGGNLKFTAVRGLDGVIAGDGSFSGYFERADGARKYFQMNVFTEPKFSPEDVKVFRDFFAAK